MPLWVCVYVILASARVWLLIIETNELIYEANQVTKPFMHTDNIRNIL